MEQTWNQIRSSQPWREGAPYEGGSNPEVDYLREQGHRRGLQRHHSQQYELFRAEAGQEALDQETKGLVLPGMEMKKTKSIAE